MKLNQYATLLLYAGTRAFSSGCNLLTEKGHKPITNNQPVAIAGIGQGFGKAMRGISELICAPLDAIFGKGPSIEILIKDFNSPDITYNLKGNKYEVCKITEKITKWKDINAKIAAEYLSGSTPYITKKRNIFICDKKDIIETLTLQNNGFIVRYIVKTKEGDEFFAVYLKHLLM